MDTNNNKCLLQDNNYFVSDVITKINGHYTRPNLVNIGQETNLKSMLYK